MLEERGARIVWAGRPEHLLVGDPSDLGHGRASRVSFASGIP
jgi:hypothetical protein